MSSHVGKRGYINISFRLSRIWPGCLSIEPENPSIFCASSRLFRFRVSQLRPVNAISCSLVFRTAAISRNSIFLKAQKIQNPFYFEITRPTFFLKPRDVNVIWELKNQTFRCVTMATANSCKSLIKKHAASGKAIRNCFLGSSDLILPEKNRKTINELIVWRWS